MARGAWLRMAECDLGRRARSAPCRPACAAKYEYAERDELLREWGAWPKRNRLPKKWTREQLAELSMQDLCRVLRSYGMPKLCCEEDRRLVDALLPLLASDALNSGATLPGPYLRSLSWQELIYIVRWRARLHAAGDDCDVAAYLDWICVTLQQAHLRTQVHEHAQKSVLPWRMHYCCTHLGIVDEWHEVDRRLDKNELVIATCSKSMLLREEMRRLFSLVVACRVVPFNALIEGKQSLESAAVLYVTGHHSEECVSLNKLDASGVWLILLNMCFTQTLARKLLSRGAINVVYWPSVVPDGVAIDFGVSMVGKLSTCSIQDAFFFARSLIAGCEQHPILLSKNDAPMNASVIIDQSGDETLRSTACSHCSAQCQFTVPYGSGSVEVRCTACTKEFQAWPCSRCERVFSKSHSLAAHTGWHSSPAQVRQARSDKHGRAHSGTFAGRLAGLCGPSGTYLLSRSAKESVSMGAPLLGAGCSSGPCVELACRLGAEDKR